MYKKQPGFLTLLTWFSSVYPFQICWLEIDSEAIVSMIMMMTMMKMMKKKKTMMMMMMMVKIWSKISVHVTSSSSPWIQELLQRAGCSLEACLSVRWQWMPAWKIDGQCDAPPKIEHGTWKIVPHKGKGNLSPKNPFWSSNLLIFVGALLSGWRF